MNKLKLFLLSMLIGLPAFAAVGLATAGALSPQVPINTLASVSTSDACAALTQIDPTQGCGTGDSATTKIIKTVVNILSYIVGIAAVIMVIVAGFKYTTSGGDSNRIGSAKNTLIYALIGMVVAALAQVLVHFVLSSAGTAPPKAQLSVTRKFG